jgi:hypothetical protein
MCLISPLLVHTTKPLSIHKFETQFFTTNLATINNNPSLFKFNYQVQNWEAITNVFKLTVAYPMLKISLNYADSFAKNVSAKDGLRLILDNSFSNNIDRNDARKLHQVLVMM